MKRKYSEVEESSTSNIYVRNNHVYFYSDVTLESCSQLIQCLEKAKEYCKQLDTPGCIYLHICTDGGDLMTSFAVVDTIVKSDIPVSTICEGCVASAGVLISLAGNKRYIARHGYMLIHELRSGCVGKYTECQDDMKNNDILMKDMMKYINERCQNKLLKTNLDAFLKRDILWNAKKCINYGLVHSIW